MSETFPAQALPTTEVSLDTTAIAQEAPSGRVEDIDEARAIADATTVQESAMADSRTLSREAGPRIASLEASKEDASIFKKLRINGEISRIENDVAEAGVQNTEYWDTLTAERDKNAAEAADAYAAERQAAVASARADVEAALG